MIFWIPSPCWTSGSSRAELHCRDNHCVLFRSDEKWIFQHFWCSPEKEIECLSDRIFSSDVKNMTFKKKILIDNFPVVPWTVSVSKLRFDPDYSNIESNSVKNRHIYYHLYMNDDWIIVRDSNEDLHQRRNQIRIEDKIPFYLHQSWQICVRNVVRVISGLSHPKFIDRMKFDLLFWKVDRRETFQNF